MSNSNRICVFVFFLINLTQNIQAQDKLVNLGFGNAYQGDHLDGAYTDFWGAPHGGKVGVLPLPQHVQVTRVLTALVYDPAEKTTIRIITQRHHPQCSGLLLWY